ncbi:hypothetical protein CCZ01_01045 [Helicobacter monodelphidis]|uniref:hypothetical protein n=1 Tax=Helicobacter sp. 15-1451 TaxID=2004995 RepID=UPI000DCE6F8A|nr:hypothetical protein [Helicobacter sp. 15-1451]RAX58813.1 hypothetical protein CCZ01_01045 [Helicobacter sp. 15-1451]
MNESQLERSLCVDYEDIFVARIFAKQKITYVESYPKYAREGSPTHLLYTMGAEGIVLTHSQVDSNFRILRYWEKHCYSQEDFIHILKDYDYIDFLRIDPQTSDEMILWIFDEIVNKKKIRILALPPTSLTQYKNLLQQNFLQGCSFRHGIYFCHKDSIELLESVCSSPSEDKPFSTPSKEALKEEILWLKRRCAELHSTVHTPTPIIHDETPKTTKKGIMQKLIHHLFTSKVKDTWKEYLRGRERYGLKKSHNQEKSNGRVLVMFCSNSMLTIEYVRSFIASMPDREIVLMSDDLIIQEGLFSQEVQPVKKIINHMRWNDEIYYILVNPFEGVMITPYIKQYGGAVLLFDIFGKLDSTLLSKEKEELDFSEVLDHHSYPHPFPLTRNMIRNEVYYSCGIGLGVQLLKNHERSRLSFIRTLLEYSDYVLLPSKESITLVLQQYPQFKQKILLCNLLPHLNPLPASEVIESDYILLAASSYNEIKRFLQAWKKSSLWNQYTLVIQNLIYTKEQDKLEEDIEQGFLGHIILTPTILGFLEKAKACFLLNQPGFQFNTYFAIKSQGILVATMSGVLKDFKGESFIPLHTNFLTEDIWRTLLHIQKGHVSPQKKLLGEYPLFEEPLCFSLSMPAFRDSPLRPKIAFEVASFLEPTGEVKRWSAGILNALLTPSYEKNYEIIPVHLNSEKIIRSYSEIFWLFLGEDLHIQQEHLDLFKGDIFLNLEHNLERILSLEVAYKELQDRGVDIYSMFYTIPTEDTSKSLSIKDSLRVIACYSSRLFCLSSAKMQIFLEYLKKENIERNAALKIEVLQMSNLIQEQLFTRGNTYFKEAIRTIRNKKLVLYLGDEDPKILEYLKIFDELWTKDENVSFLLLSDTTQNGEAKKQVQKHKELHKRLWWLEGYSSKELQTLFRHCSVCIMSDSIIGIAIAEALGESLQIIINDSPHNQELLGKNSIAPQSLTAQTLKEILNKPKEQSTAQPLSYTQTIQNLLQRNKL